MVERTAPTAYRSAPVLPIGVSPLMPPHSQGAERRQEHRAGRTGSRWSLRVLVIGGLAGAAWLLTGAAAQAADRDPAGGGLSLGSSLIGAVVHGDDHSAPVVGRVLKAAVKPLAPERHRGSGSAVAAPDKAAHSSSDADSALGGVVGVVRGLTAPLHLSGDAVDTRKLVPVTDVREPEPPQAAKVPATAPAAPERPIAHEPADPKSDVDQADAVVVDEDEDERVSAAAPERDRWHPVGKTVARQHSIAADRHPAAATAAKPETVSDTPGGDGPAPERVHLGPASGVPASGPGTATEGGAAAFLPAKVTDSTVACHRLPIATDVGVRRHDAEAPTVSPD
ncbi:hypothetical protein [Actinoplanes sp. NPDC049599]|uniref:hypothetical protein n=1 Tax=Actinoplanes sp. NPDC049599 TaxID=3363903 RepID=UPI003796F700